MAYVSDVVEVIAEAEGIPPASVALIARHAREAGLLSQGARGKNAPKATVRDCVNLLIGVNATGCLIKNTPYVISVFRDLQPTLQLIPPDYDDEKQNPFSSLKRDKSGFGCVLENLIELFIAGDAQCFLMNMAREHLPTDFYEKAKKDFGGNQGLIDERERYACELFVNRRVIDFAITFNRPAPGALIRLSRPNLERSTINEDVVLFTYHPPLDSELMGVKEADQINTTKIGYKTINEVAKLLA